MMIALGPSDVTVSIINIIIICFLSLIYHETKRTADPFEFPKRVIRSTEHKELNTFQFLIGLSNLHFVLGIKEIKNINKFLTISH